MSSERLSKQWQKVRRKPPNSEHDMYPLQKWIPSDKPFISSKEIETDYEKNK